MAHSLTDLAGLRVSAEAFLTAVLESAAQPIWVVDPEGRIRFANPAAIAALGYDRPEELFGCRSHETIHYKHPDGTAYPAAQCPMLLPRTTGETVTSDLDWFCRRDGSMFPVSYVSVPIAMPDGRGAVVAFTDIEDRLCAEQALREREAMFGAREDSLRRIAALVAGGAASTDVFAAIAAEVGHVLSLPVVLVCRYDPGRTTATVIGAWGEDRHPFRAGTRWPLDGPAILAEVAKSGRPARIDDYTELPGTIADAVRTTGFRAVAGAPIIVDGDVWGAMMAGTAAAVALPDKIEDRLAEFTELVATAISNTASRDQLARLAEEQAALRRVATLVARGVPSPEIFAAVAREVGLLLGVDWTHMARYEPDASSTGVAGWSPAGDEIPIGTRVSLDGVSVRGLVLRTGRPARMHYDAASGQAAALGRERGLRSSVGAPIVVDQRIWGVMIAATKDDRPLPADTESRLENFTELVATAIANAEARTEVAASRARIVAATDEERRRVVRDLHDGAQQRLVHTIVTLTMARRAMQNGEEDLPALLAEALENAKQATVELRELVHGILPGALTRGGLRAGVDALASRMPVPVENAVSLGRLPAAVEATAYFVVAEALTNVAKHARAGRASVAAGVHGGTLQVEVRDDGVGGARPDGSGLLGLADRLAALDGRLRVESLVDGGTLVAADIPVPA